MQYPAPPHFQPSRMAGLMMMQRIRPGLYSKTRNYLDGAVTHLSPWISHGFLSLHEVAQWLHAQQALSFDDKIVYEFAWREFFAHVHAHLGPAIFEDIRRPAWAVQYSNTLPEDIAEGRTGLQAIDEAVRMLYTTGYLHNHARMWLASYIVHMRKVHWRTGANWMYQHLLDGDLASNHLSWQWVAGTFSHKPYVFNADNVHKFAKHWNCKNTQLDTRYEDLEHLARSRATLSPEPTPPYPGMAEPSPLSAQAALALHPKLTVNVLHEAQGLKHAMETAQQAAQQGQNIHLLHPWNLGAVESEHTPNTLCIGILDLAFHEQHPWTARRWQFVLEGLAAHTDTLWLLDSHQTLPAAGPHSTMGTQAQLTLFAQFAHTGCAMRHARTHNPGYHSLHTLLPTQGFAWPHLLPWPATLQASFSRFYQACSQQAGSLDAMLETLSANMPTSGPLNQSKSNPGKPNRHTQHSPRQSA